MAVESTREKVAKWTSLIVCVGGLSFMSGMFFHQYDIFPSSYVRDVDDAVNALMIDTEYKQRAKLENVDMHVRKPNFWFPTSYVESGVTIDKRDKQSPGYSFYTGSTSEAYLLKPDGEILHKWSMPFYELWPDPPHITSKTTEDMIYWRMAQPQPDGSLIAMYEGINQAPYGGGMVKLDKDSNVIWSLALNTHHKFDIADNGDIYVLTHRYSTSGRARIDDYLTIITPEGKYTSHSLLEGLRNSPFRKKIKPDPSKDYMHTNSVHVLSESIADKFPIFEAGDILMSMKVGSYLTVFDGKTFTAKWLLTGMTISNHDADFLENGNILFMDNDYKAFTPEYTIHNSRVLEVNPVTMELVWSYENSPDSVFFTQNRGSQMKLANGNVLITESTGGRLFEVTLDGEIVWEFITPDIIGGSIGVVNWAQRYTAEELPFIKSLPGYSGKLN
jgi:outer membrane protein assembly factor BamB